ncbi:unnamed protein product, partial [Trichobilharzia szidati]
SSLSEFFKDHAYLVCIMISGVAVLLLPLAFMRNSQPKFLYIHILLWIMVILCADMLSLDQSTKSYVDNVHTGRSSSRVIYTLRDVYCCQCPNLDNGFSYTTRFHVSTSPPRNFVQLLAVLLFSGTDMLLVGFV